MPGRSRYSINVCQVSENMLIVVKRVADTQQLAFSAGTEFQRNSTKGD